jgi:three-Cys-motif partner protein
MAGDGLYTPEVGPWAERKYAHLKTFTHMFATGMHKRWPVRIYIDLFAGAGRARVKGTFRLLDTSALIALSARNRFDRYVLCDRSPRCINALRERVRREHPDADVRYVRGDCNATIEQVLAELPAPSAPGVLGCCVADPFGLKALHFETIRRLSAFRMDFVVLIPSFMSANRNKAFLTRDSSLLDDFLGTRDWRQRWIEAEAGSHPPTFGNFVVDEFGRSMNGLGFLRSEPSDPVLVDDENRKLYHLAAYSRNPLGSEFWRKAKRSASKQEPLPGF